MKHDRNIKIAVGKSRRSVRWPSTEMTWQAFAEKCQTPVTSSETGQEYISFPKSKQDELKDVGGFVGGTFKGGIRSVRNVIGRDLITLDLDSIPPGETERIKARVYVLGCAALIYSTRKHRPDAPRLRIIIPTDRTMSAEEYIPCARKMAALIGIEYADPTTFDINRLMYWPSKSKDTEYVYEVYDSSFIRVDYLLDLYADWRDCGEWPVCPGEEKIRTGAMTSQMPPKEKTGIVGAFCRSYGIREAISKFIPEEYISAGSDRYTYAKGSTVAGAIIYGDGDFLYSHHATDPAGGRLVNSFDLVRLHLFGDRDDGAAYGTPTNNLPSYRLMVDLATKDARISNELARENSMRAREAFKDKAAGCEAEDPEEWIKNLDLTSQKRPANTIDNVVSILEHDPRLRGTLALDEFANRGLVIGPLPWDKDFREKRIWNDADDANVRRYLEKAYGISTRDKISDGLLIVSSNNGFHEVRDYLNALCWDGTDRLDRLLIDYLGADDTDYTRAVTRKAFCAAAARIFKPGIKFDTMTILYGPQGIGKSTLLATMAGQNWFSDSLQTFQGKDAAEMLQGVWINEIGELYAMSYSDINAVKQFLSKRDDVYREAYGRRTNRFPRQCVFFGTSNKAEFLRDRTGNRRFWPVNCTGKAVKSIWDDLPRERDQLWAEAKARFVLGERLFLDKSLEQKAKEEQESHREVSAKEGLIREFIEREVPEDWGNFSLAQRRVYWQSEGAANTLLVPRNRICAAEIWCELFGGDIKQMGWKDSNEINEIMASFTDWERNKSVRRYGPYGRQRGYEKVNVMSGELRLEVQK